VIRRDTITPRSTGKARPMLLPPEIIDEELVSFSVFTVFTHLNVILSLEGTAIQLMFKRSYIAFSNFFRQTCEVKKEVKLDSR